MSELIQLLQLAQEGTLSTKVDNLIAVAQAHDSEIQQLRDQVNQMIDAHNGFIGTSSTTGIITAIAIVALIAGIIGLAVENWQIRKRVSALEAQK